MTEAEEYGYREVVQAVRLFCPSLSKDPHAGRLREALYKLDVGLRLVRLFEVMGSGA